MCLPSEQLASAGPGGGQRSSEPLELWTREPLESGAFPFRESRATIALIRASCNLWCQRSVAFSCTRFSERYHTLLYEVSGSFLNYSSL